ncbi:hypothetical protein EPI10_029222 [Gossypium australe]|uniref:Uncharacterized protein n=1 Tax=Gossypium australe TaxID=47621 RepID=A0A5B6V132_9ROSI|nr:hypothetical protein EPI10_029222 [Gossypium australe]
MIFVYNFYLTQQNEDDEAVFPWLCQEIAVQEDGHCLLLDTTVVVAAPICLISVSPTSPVRLHIHTSLHHLEALTNHFHYRQNSGRPAPKSINTFLDGRAKRLILLQSTSLIFVCAASPHDDMIHETADIHAFIFSFFTMTPTALFICLPFHIASTQAIVTNLLP